MVKQAPKHLTINKTHMLATGTVLTFHRQTQRWDGGGEGEKTTQFGTQPRHNKHSTN